MAQKSRKGMMHSSAGGHGGPTFNCYIVIIVGPSAAALSGAQNSDLPQRKSALNRYCKNRKLET